MHFDKRLPQAEMRGFQPFQGLLTIKLAQDCAVRVRIPEFVAPGALKAGTNGAPVRVRVWAIIAGLGRHAGGTIIKITYPLDARTEGTQIGNPGFTHYRYRVHWRGDTVMAMEPVDDEVATGYSDFEGKNVPVFYGREGSGLLYQRAAFLDGPAPTLTPLVTDDGSSITGVLCPRPTNRSEATSCPLSPTGFRGSLRAGRGSVRVSRVLKKRVLKKR